MYRKGGHPQPRSNRLGPGIPCRSTAPATTSGFRSFWEGRKQRRSGYVLITATMSIRSSLGLLMMIVLIDLAKRSQQDRNWRRAFIEYEKAEPQCVDSAMPSVSRSTKRFSYLPAACIVGCSSPSPAANTDSCIRSTQHLIREITKLLGTIQTLKVDTALLPRTCHICQF